MIVLYGYWKQFYTVHRRPKLHPEHQKLNGSPCAFQNFCKRKVFEWEAHRVYPFWSSKSKWHHLEMLFYERFTWHGPRGRLPLSYTCTILFIQKEIKSQGGYNITLSDFYPAGTVRTMYVHCTYSWYNVRTMYIHCTYSARWVWPRNKGSIVTC